MFRTIAFLTVVATTPFKTTVPSACLITPGVRLSTADVQTLEGPSDWDALRPQERSTRIEKLAPIFHALLIRACTADDERAVPLLWRMLRRFPEPFLPSAPGYLPMYEDAQRTLARAIAARPDAVAQFVAVLEAQPASDLLPSAPRLPPGREYMLAQEGLHVIVSSDRAVELDAALGRSNMMVLYDALSAITLRYGGMPGPTVSPEMRVRLLPRILALIQHPDPHVQFAAVRASVGFYAPKELRARMLTLQRTPGLGRMSFQYTKAVLGVLDQIDREQGRAPPKQ